MFSGAREVIEQQLICVCAVEIVRIHNGKRPPNPPSRGEDGVTGPPRLRAARRRGGRLQGLVREHDFEPGADDVRHVTTERLLDLRADHEHDLTKAGTRRVVHTVVEERFAARAHGNELLQPAVAAAEPGREDNESGYWICRMRSRRNFRPRASCVSTVFSLMPSRLATSA